MKIFAFLLTVALLTIQTASAQFNPSRASGPLGWHYGLKILWVRASGDNIVKFGVPLMTEERVIELSGTAEGVRAMQAVLVTAYTLDKMVNVNVSQAVYGTPYSYKIGEISF